MDDDRRPCRAVPRVAMVVRLSDPVAGQHSQAILKCRNDRAGQHSSSAHALSSDRGGQSS
jgi:hypothetical protein